MRHRFCGSLLLVSGALLCSGCSLWRDKEDATVYETISANPQYDTQTAMKEHSKAIKVLNKYLYGKTTKLAEAEVHLQKALTADITYGPAHNTLGVVEMLKRNFYTAAWEFEYAVKLMPDNFEPLYNLGQLYESADKIDHAIIYYEQAMELAPRDPTVIGNLAGAKLRNGASIEEVRPLLDMLVFHDHRPEWLAWAQDQLGRKPIQHAAAAEMTSPPSDTTETPEAFPKLTPDSPLPPNPGIPSELGPLPDLNSPTPDGGPLPPPLEEEPGRASLDEF